MQSATARSSLSDAFVYGNKPRPAPATKSPVLIYPEHGGSSGFAPGNTIRLVVPTGNRREYLNTRQSYIKFRLNNLATDVNDAFAMDSTAHGLFRCLAPSGSGSMSTSFSCPFRSLKTLLLKLKLKLFTTCTVCAGFSPKAGCVGCCLWALPTMPYMELTSQG
jgi:hypothetical protein